MAKLVRYQQSGQMWDTTNLNRQADGFSHPKIFSFSSHLFPFPTHFLCFSNFVFLPPGNSCKKCK